MNKLIYVIAVDGKGSDDYTDEDFKTKGTAYTLKEFQDAFNYNDAISEAHYIRVLDAPQYSFNITSVCREDFEERGYDASGLSDAEMTHIASKMADVYVENDFWISIDFHAEDKKLPLLESKYDRKVNDGL